MPAARRHFLGWNAPCPRLGAEWLIALAASRHGDRDIGEADLSRTIVIVPTGRSGRLLLGELVDACEAAQLALAPPTLLTPAEVPGALLDVSGEPASPILRLAAWMQALQSLDAPDLAALLRHPPDPGRPGGWRALAELLLGTHDELLSACRTFTQAREVSDDDPARWAAAEHAQTRAFSLLTSWGRIDPAWAEAQALREARWADTRDFDRLVLLGITDASPMVRACLAGAPLPVEALIAAPEALADRFDDLGMIRPEAWPAPLLDNAAVLFAESPARGAEVALALLGDLPQPVNAADVCIVVTDPALAHAVELKADELGGVRVRPAPGPPASQTAPGQLLRGLAAFLDEPSVVAALDLVRHPDVDDALRRADAQGTGAAPPPPTPLSRAIKESIPDGVEQWTTPPRSREAPDPAPGASLTSALHVLQAALDTLMAPAGDPADGVEWLRAVLSGVYAAACGMGPDTDPDFTPDDRTGAALDRIVSDLAELAAAPALPAITVLALVQHSLERAAIPAPHDPGAIEVVGWLELAFDPAGVVVVLGANEGSLPASTPEHPLLTAPVRRALGLGADADRAARDAYLLDAATAARQRLALIALRRDAAGDPVHPSRLIMGGPAPVAAARAVRFTRPELDPPRRWTAPPAGAGFAPRVYPAAVPPTVMGVTWFREYLKSPRLFYLRRVRALIEGEASTRSLHRGEFGSLIHAVAPILALPELCAETDPARIAEALHTELSRVASERFAGPPGVLLGVQLTLARRRLEALARAHAQRCREGWRVVNAEFSPPAGEPWLVDGAPVTLRGSIDRIELHDSGRAAIIDYKTSKDGKSPEKAHRTKLGWIDLQLPMYRHLARQLLTERGIAPDRITLAYITLPDHATIGEFQASDWGETELREADDAARDVVRRVRAGEFDDLRRPPRDGTFGIVLQPDDLVPDDDDDAPEEDDA